LIFSVYRALVNYSVNLRTSDISVKGVTQPKQRYESSCAVTVCICNRFK